ncbi:MAG: hypothetical protein ACLFUQ_05850 [Candidatus Izemoplasmataceae bacterium]
MVDCHHHDVVLVVTYVIAGRHIPIHASEHKIDGKRLFYEETSRFVHGDIAVDEVTVHEDDTYQYVYPLKSIGNGSCLSDYYVWDGFKTHRLSESFEEGIVSLDDFLDSDLVVRRPISTDE